jgi:hypothetical protein
MQLVNVIHISSSDGQCCEGMLEWNKMGHFGKLLNHHKDAVKGSRLG